LLNDTYLVEAAWMGVRPSHKAAFTKLLLKDFVGE
jgi:hypothetical protein